MYIYYKLYSQQEKQSRTRQKGRNAITIVCESNFCSNSINSLPNNKIYDWSKLKAFADDKISINEKLKFGLGRVENIEGK